MYMKYIKYLTLGLAATTVLTITGCADDYLDVTSTRAVSNVTMSESLDNLNLAVNGIHRKMVSQDLNRQGLGGEPGFMMSRDFQADDITWEDNTWHRASFLNWDASTNATSIDNYGIWETYYKFILNSNMILEALETLKESTSFSLSQERQYGQIKGEALCIRAWSHFNLVQYYAKRYVGGTTNSQPGIPLRKTSSIENVGRSSVEDVYSAVHADLDAAIPLLEGYNAGLNHYTQKVAYGLKARVALTQQNYSAAANYAVKSIELAEAGGARIMTADQLMHGFANITTETKEALYAAMTRDDQTVYFYSYYAYMAWNFNATAVRTGVKCISQSTYDMMSETDLRRQWWDPTGEAGVPTSAYIQHVYQNRKFTARSTADPVGDVAFMRLSEMYLTAAEAFARSGNDAEAKKYLQALIAERDPQYSDLGNTGDALAEEIMTHRRIELWGEGFRWFDLKRLNLPLKREGSNFKTNIYCAFLEKPVTDLGWVYEIPKRETDFNPIEKNHI